MDSPRSRRRIWLIITAAAVVIGLGAALWWWIHRNPVHYVTAKVTAGDIRRTVGMTGSLNPVVTAQVGSYVSGNIKSWSCDYNTMVKIGQSCALIDPLPFQVVVDEDVADVNTSEAQLVKDRAALVNAKVTFERDSKLLDQGIVSQAQIDTDKSAFDQSKAQIVLDVATIASKKASLKAAQVNLAYTNIVSPVDGMVITRYIDVGQTVVTSLQSSTLFLIGKDMTKMQVDTNVSEADVGDVAVGQKAYFSVQAYPTRTFWGSVRQIRRGPITVQNVVTYDVVVDVDNEDLALYPGMTADAHIITAEHANVLRVPLPATRFVPEGMARQARDESGARRAEGQPRDDDERPEHGMRGGGTRGDNDTRGARTRGDDGADRSGGARADGGTRGDSDAGAGGGTRAGGAGRRAGAGSDSGGPALATRRNGQGARPQIGRLWLLVNGTLQSVRVRTGLDDGTLIEVSGTGLKAGDEVVVNAVRPNASPTALLSETPQQARGANRQQAGPGPRF